MRVGVLGAVLDEAVLVGEDGVGDVGSLVSNDGSWIADSCVR